MNLRDSPDEVAFRAQVRAWLADNLPALPVRGDQLFHGQKEVGHLTSVVYSPAWQANLALGYVRREANAVGTELRVVSSGGDSTAKIVELPFGT